MCIQQNFARILTGHSDNYSNTVASVYVKKCICTSWIAFKNRYVGTLCALQLCVNSSNCFTPERKKSAVHFAVLLLKCSKLLNGKFKIWLAINFNFSVSSTVFRNLFFLKFFPPS